MMNNFDVGDKLILKKEHACQSNKWEVLKAGIDVKLKCLKCERTIHLQRVDLLKQIKDVERNINEKN